MPTIAARPPRVQPRGAVALLALLLGLLLSGSAHAEDWPQFRGPDGRGVATDVTMPADFGPDSAELQWKVPLRGTGISSPIVSKGKVFVTAAYQGEERSKLRGITVGTMISLATVVCLAGLLRLRRRKRDADATPDPGWMRFLNGLDSVAVFGAGLGFLALALVATLQPDRLWSSGIPGNAWLVTSTVGLAGLVAAFGTFPARSVWRLFGVVVLAAAALLLLDHLPLNKHREVFRNSYRLVMVGPAIAGASWYLFLFLLARRYSTARFRATALLAAPALVAMAALLFASSNFLSPQAGLVRGLLCLDLESGALLWDAPLLVAPEERLHAQNSFATPTPCTDGERVFAYFGPGYACVDYDGNILWEGRDDTYVENSRYGCVTSPVLFEDTFIINQESEQELRTSYIMALDRTTGDVRWRIEPEDAHDSYMTPSLMPVGGETQLIVVSIARVVGYDPRTGEMLWDLALPTWQHAPSLTYEDDVLYVSGGAHVKWVTAAIRLSGKGKDTKTEILWQTNKTVPKSSSPVLYDGLYYQADNEFMICLDPATGKRMWKQRMGGLCLASLIAADGKIIVCFEEGGVQVVEAGSEFRLASQADLGETIRSSPAIADGRVLIRTADHLYCFEGG